VNLAADPDDGQPCSAHLDCAAGLLCAGLSREADGLCLPAWMQSRFEERPHLELADAATTTTELEVYGLATVDMDVFLEAEIEHAQPRDLRVTLTNPAGNEVLVLEGAAGEGGALEIDDPIVGFSGDEQVNGRWTLTVTDRTSGAAGRLDRWALRIGSRFD
jgi:subtilisin-like proprotein convertase family protein